jgi:type I restriction enzyme, S subunit
MEIECPDGWELAGLRELGEVNRGRSRHRPRYAEHLYGGPYPFIQTGDVKASNGRVTSYTQTYSEAGLAQSRLWPAGTMCITIAANIAETGILTFPACFPDSVVGFIAAPHKADVQFVEYMFRFLRSRIQHQATGSVQDNINIETLERLRFPLPPVAQQKAIAAVLGALDDKIELNRRMNATLEAMARALFQSWFVDFDPVRAKLDGRKPVGLDAATTALFPDSFDETELGHVPHGWEVRTLGEVIELAYGKPLKAEDRKNGPICVFGANGPVGWHDEKLVTGPGIVVGRKGNPGVVTWAHSDFYPIDTTFYVEPKVECRSLYFLYYALSLHNLANLSADSAVPGLNRNHAYMSKQVIPSQAVVAAFDSQISPIFAAIYANEEQSRTLATLRDTLLPKLLSGELRVAGLESRLAGAVAESATVQTRKPAP